MAEGMTKAVFLGTLRTERARWDAALGHIDPARLMQPGRWGDWSIKDLVAHVTWHEREMIGVFRQRALVGSDLWDLETDERNAAIYIEQRDRLLDEILAENRAIAPALLSAAATLSDEDLNDTNRFRDMPTDTDWAPWQLFADNTYDHYRAHLPTLAAAQD